MNEYVVTVWAAEGMYEETVQAESRVHASRVAVSRLVSEGEIMEGMTVQVRVEEIE